MAQFATADDLAARLGIDLTYEELGRADTLLELASGIIQSESGQTIELVEDDTYTRSGPFDGSFRLPQRPVLDVASVSINGTSLASLGWYLDGDQITTRQRGSGNYRGPFFPHLIEVVYTHGYDPIPAVVKAVCLEMVVRAWTNPGAVARETVGNVSTVYDNMRFSPTGLLMSDAERQQVNDIVRLQTLSMALR